jgi:ribonucleotide reductase beta subunit family protein with ferritin-like domain
MFFGQPLGVQQYTSFKYPIFEKITQTQLGFFWKPDEISLQKDRSDYQSLRPEHKHIFTSNLKYQIMLDSVQGRGPGLAFIPYCSLLNWSQPWVCGSSWSRFTLAPIPIL